MAAAALVIFFIVAGAGVAFVAFSGGPGRAREAYLTGGRRFFRIVLPLLYLGVGIAVPAVVIASRHSAEGGVGTLAGKQGTKQVQRGKMLFRQTCASCHSLAAVNARGVTGPNLDQIGQVTRQRVLNALRIGGTGDGRMPAGLLTGANAHAVATFVSSVAGRGNP
ncbi:MAG: c-type cytochrome [Actinobacteria bacterium]|nr:c-type cytochrome [Actinomycetota bacterium]